MKLLSTLTEILEMFIASYCERLRVDESAWELAVKREREFELLSALTDFRARLA